MRDGTAYPAVLFTVFDGDTRVDPLHARKLCAALQHATAGDRAGRCSRARARRRPRRAGAVTQSVELSADMLAFTARGPGSTCRELGPAPTAERRAARDAAASDADRADDLAHAVDVSTWASPLIVVIGVVIRWLLVRAVIRPVDRPAVERGSRAAGRDRPRDAECRRALTRCR